MPRRLAVRAPCRHPRSRAGCSPHMSSKFDEIERLERALVVPLLHEARAGKSGDVRQVAGGDAGRQLRGEVTRAGVVHRRPAALLPWRDHRPERVLLGAGPRADDADLATDVLACEAAARGGTARWRGPRRSGPRRALAGRWCHRSSRAFAGRSGRLAPAAACSDKRCHAEQRAEPAHPAPLARHVVLLSGQPQERPSSPPKGRAQLIDRQVPCDAGGPVEPRTTSSVGSNVRCATARSAIRSSKARPAACPSSKAGRRTVVSGGSK